MSTDDLGFLTVREVCKLLGFSRQAIWEMERRGEFPAKVQLGARKVGFARMEINDWCKRRIAERDARKAEAAKYKDLATVEVKP